MSDPLTKQRSPWLEVAMPAEVERLFSFTSLEPFYFERNVSDGVLCAVLCEELVGWHLSLTHIAHNAKITRYPTWDEVGHARTVLLPDQLAFAMILPPIEEFMEAKKSTFHIREYPERVAE